jgi:hypothetical protein
MGITAADLQASSPFLFDTILMVSDVSNANRQLRMERRIREAIGSSVVANGEMSLDLIQGLLVVLAWYQFQLELKSSFGGFLHVALGMLRGLGLGRKPGAGAGGTSMLRLDDFRFDPTRQNAGRTLDERRVYLGCFYLSAVYFALSLCFSGTANKYFQSLDMYGRCRTHAIHGIHGRVLSCA